MVAQTTRHLGLSWCSFDSIILPSGSIMLLIETLCWIEGALWVVWLSSLRKGSRFIFRREAAVFALTGDNVAATHSRSSFSVSTNWIWVVCSDWLVLLTVCLSSAFLLGGVWYHIELGRVIFAFGLKSFLTSKSHTCELKGFSDLFSLFVRLVIRVWHTLWNKRHVEKQVYGQAKW